MDKFFAVCAPGLETFLAHELERLGLSASPTAPAGHAAGGVEFQADLPDLYRANLWLRTASRVIVRLGEFYAAAFPELVRKASRLPWERHLAPGQPVALRVTCKKSRLYHSGGVAERVARAIGERLGRLPAVQKFNEGAEVTPPQLVIVRLANDHCTISVDSSGALLHRRGYRQAVAKAPLRETLAAGMLMASGWDMTSPLLDPFCGSGTIPIEAALMARNIPPGRARRFTFMDWPDFDQSAWSELLAVATSSLLPRPALWVAGEEPGMRASILASDRDAGAIQAAQANAERAGVADCIEFSCRAVSAVEPPPGPGWVVTNPPYGVRVSGSRDLRNLYAQFGNVMRAKCPGWRVALLREADSDQLIHNTGLAFDAAPGIPLVNGGLKVKLMRGNVDLKGF
jgi:putative N6-adenine-specific DNA methylase